MTQSEAEAAGMVEPIDFEEVGASEDYTSGKIEAHGARTMSVDALEGNDICLHVFTQDWQHSVINSLWIQYEKACTATIW